MDRIVMRRRQGFERYGELFLRARLENFYPIFTFP